MSPTPIAHAEVVLPTFSPPEGLDFGTVRVNHLPTGSEFRTEVFSNTNTFALAGIQLGQSPLSQFHIDAGSTCLGSNLILQPGQTCQITVAFAPFSAGAVSESISVSACAQSCGLGGAPLQLGGFGLTGYGTNVSPFVSSSPSSLDFGMVNIAGGSASSTINLQLFVDPLNPLVFQQSYSTFVTDPTNFSVTDDPNCKGSVTVSQIAPCHITVTFNPHEARAFHQRLIIDPIGEFPLLGSGGVTAPTVAGSGALGDVRVNTSQTRDIVLTNPGPNALQFVTPLGPLDTINVPITLTGSSGLSVASSSCSGALPALSRCTVTLQFSPSARGSAAATLAFHDDAVNSPQTVSVTARGVAPLVSLDAPGGILDFGTLAVGSTPTLTSGRRTLHVTNTGDFLLTFHTTLTGAGYALSSTSNCGTSLDPGAGCLLVVDFSPPSPGAHPGELRIDDDAVGSPHLVQLTGSGAPAPVVSFLTAPPSFGLVPISGPGRTLPVSLANGGSADLTFSAAVNGPGYSLTSDGTCPPSGTLVPGSLCTFVVLFKPTAIGQADGSLVLTDNAFGSPQSVALSGIGASPDVAFDASFVSFPDQNVGAPPASRTVAIRSTGNQDLLISGLGVGPDFHIDDSSGCPRAPAPLVPGADCKVTLSFRPTGRGTFDEALTLSDNAPGGTHGLKLHGVALQPSVSLVGPAGASSIDFGRVAQGFPSQSRTATLTNTGNGPLTISSVSVGADYHLASSTCPQSPSTLAAGANCSIDVIAQPTALGPLSEELQIADDAPGSPHSLPLHTEGVVPQPALSITPSGFPGLVFADQPLGTSSADQPVTLRNVGNAALRIDSLGLLGSFGIDSTTCPVGRGAATLDPGLSCLVQVRFMPLAQGPLTSVLLIQANAPGSPFTVTTSGRGTPPLPRVLLSASTLDFGQVALLTSVTRTVTLTNIGQGQLTLQRYALPTPFVLGQACPATLAPLQSCTLSITATPAVAGNLGGAVQVFDDAPDSPQAISLTGTAVDLGGGTGCAPDCGGPPPVGQTPELDSILLFASGSLGLVYYLRRPRFPRRRR